MEIKELGHIVLYVRDLEASRRFYGEVLGWRETNRAGDFAAVFSSGRTHHELLLLGVGPDAAPIPEGRRVGLYHFGLKVGDTDDELREALAHITAKGVEIAGTADHGVTHSLYIKDPDGNEVELYVDVMKQDWRAHPEMPLSAPQPLRL